MSTYDGSEIEPEVDPGEYSPEQRELDELGPVLKPVHHDRMWWGKAIPNHEHPGFFEVDRYADYEHALAACDKPVWVPSVDRRKSVRVLPMTASQDMGQTWYFAAIGWEVPT